MECVGACRQEGKLFYQRTDGCFRSFFVYTPSYQKFSEFGGNGNLSPPSSLLPRKGAPGKWVFATSLPFLKIEKRNSEHAKGKHKQNSYVQWKNARHLIWRTITAELNCLHSSVRMGKAGEEVKLHGFSFSFGGGGHVCLISVQCRP